MEKITNCLITTSAMKPPIEIVRYDLLPKSLQKDGCDYFLNLPIQATQVPWESENIPPDLMMAIVMGSTSLQETLV